MKISNVLTLFCVILILVGCEKEELHIDHNSIDLDQNISFVQYDWSNDEEIFFDLPKSFDNSNLISTRSGIHPGIVMAFNKVATDNEEHDFVSEIYRKLGVPFWLDSRIATQGDDYIVFTPIYSDDNKVTSFFVSNIESGQVDVDLRVKSIIDESIQTKTTTTTDCMDYLTLKAFQYQLTNNFDGFDESAFCNSCLKKDFTNGQPLSSRCRTVVKEMCIELPCNTEFPEFPNGSGGGSTSGSGSGGYGNGGIGGNGGHGNGGGHGSGEHERPLIYTLVSFPGLVTAMQHTASAFNGEGFSESNISSRSCIPETVCNLYNVLECQIDGIWGFVETLECLNCNNDDESDDDVNDRERICIDRLENILSGAPYYGNHEFTPEEQLALIGPDGSACSNMDEFKKEIEDEIVKNIINECYENQMSEFLISLNLTVAEANAVCGNASEVSDPTCITCSEQELQMILDAHNEALEMLECAYEELGEFGGPQDVIVENCFNNQFGGPPSDFKIRLLQIYIRLLQQGLSDNQIYLNGSNAECTNNNGQEAGGYVNPGNPIIYLCPLFFSRPDLQSWIVIHEATHAFLDTGDLAYVWSESYSELNSFQPFLNADSYSSLIDCLCPE